jgi:hypothetical protein
MVYVCVENFSHHYNEQSSLRAHRVHLHVKNRHTRQLIRHPGFAAKWLCKYRSMTHELIHNNVQCLAPGWHMLRECAFTIPRRENFTMCAAMGLRDVSAKSCRRSILDVTQSLTEAKEAVVFGISPAQPQKVRRQRRGRLCVLIMRVQRPTGQRAPPSRENTPPLRENTPLQRVAAIAK